MEATFPLESWLGRSDGAGLRPAASAASLQHASQAWPGLRRATESEVLSDGPGPLQTLRTALSFLRLLRAHRFFLHISEADAQLLLKILAEDCGFALGRASAAESAYSPEQTPVQLTEEASSCCLLLLAVWVQRLAQQSQARARVTLHARVIVVKHAVQLLAEASANGRCPFGSCGAAVLLLGSALGVPGMPASSYDLACRGILSQLAEGWQTSSTYGLPELFAGIGYAMAACQQGQLADIFAALLAFWDKREWQHSIPGSRAPECPASMPPLEQVLLLTRMTEYEGARLQTQAMSFAPGVLYSTMSMLCQTCKEAVVSLTRTQGHSPEPCACVAVMAAAGLLRGLSQGMDRTKVPAGGVPEDRRVDLRALTAREQIVTALEALLLEATRLSSMSRGIHDAIKVCSVEEVALVMEGSVLEYIAVAAGRLHAQGGAGLPSHPELLQLLINVLFYDVLQLSPFCEALAAGGILESRAQIALEKHFRRPIFKEAPLLARALCAQFQGADGNSKGMAILHISEYVHALHGAHSMLAVAWRHDGAGGRELMDGKLSQVHKQALEVAFLSLCVLLAAAVPEVQSETSRPHSHSTAPSLEGMPSQQYAVDAIEILALLEFCRLPVAQYGMLVKRAVGSIAGDHGAIINLLHHLPSYESLVAGEGITHQHYYAHVLGKKWQAHANCCRKHE